MNRLATVTLLAIVALSVPIVARAIDPAIAAKRAQVLSPQHRVDAFRTMDSAYPFHVIKRGGAVSDLPRRLHKLDVSYRYQGRQHTLDDLLQRSRAQGLLVIHDGHVVDERYFNGADQDTKFTSWSMAKSVTSTLVGLALSDARIKSLDDPVTNYLPELKGSGYDGVPIRDILQMSSGVNFTEEYGKQESDVMIMWRKTMDEGSLSFADYARTLGRAEAPGTKFVYRSVDTGVLGMLVKRVTGTPLAEMASRRIWQPIGAEADATWLTVGSGSDALEAAYCCINATLRDYGRFGLLFLHNGRVGDKQIVPSSWVNEATNPQSPQVGWGKLFPNAPEAYGYQWWLTEPGPEHPFAAEGVFFQFIYVAPKYNMVIVKTSAFDDFWSVPMEIEQLVAFDAIGEALTGHQQAAALTR